MQPSCKKSVDLCKMANMKKLLSIQVAAFAYNLCCLLYDNVSIGNKMTDVHNIEGI